MVELFVSIAYTSDVRDSLFRGGLCLLLVLLFQLSFFFRALTVELGTGWHSLGVGGCGEEGGDGCGFVTAGGCGKEENGRLTSDILLDLDLDRVGLGGGAGGVVFMSYLRNIMNYFL